MLFEVNKGIPTLRKCNMRDLDFLVSSVGSQTSSTEGIASRQ